jgi:hypothetical protein
MDACCESRCQLVIESAEIKVASGQRRKIDWILRILSSQLLSDLKCLIEVACRENLIVLGDGESFELACPIAQIVGLLFVCRSFVILTLKCLGYSQNRMGQGEVRVETHGAL